MIPLQIPGYGLRVGSAQKSNHQFLVLLSLFPENPSITFGVILQADKRMRLQI